MNVAYIDGSLLIRRSYLEAKINTTDTVKLLDDLGFTIHPTKSALEPTQVIEFLGFTIDSRTMRIKLTERKAIDIIEMCFKFIKKRAITIRDFAQLIGKLIASQPGVDYAPVYIKTLEISKDYWLKKNKGNFVLRNLYVISVHHNSKSLLCSILCFPQGHPNLSLNYQFLLS
jgi:hypothetical protein